MAANNRRSSALVSLTRVVNKMAAGACPDPVVPFLCGARLHAALKKDQTIRPIAVGNLMRRLVAKCMAFSLAEGAATVLAPHQMGVGVRNDVRQLFTLSGRQWKRTPPECYCS